MPTVRSDERGSMSILLLVVLVGLMFGSLLVPMIITSSRTSSFDKTRVQALDAAQAGIDVTLGAIRSSVTDGAGISAKLPCGPGSGTLTGTATSSYAVVVEYFTADPGLSTNPTPMKCVAGYGPYDVATLATTPGYARITSTGTANSTANGAAPSRTLVSTYVFLTSDVYTVGGQLQISGGSAALCIDAGTAPVAGTALVLQTCSTSSPLSAQQVFAYRTDLTLQLVSSVTTATPLGLCLVSARTPAVAGDAVKLATCGALGTPVYSQQFSYNDNGQYQASQADSATTGALPNLCLNVNNLSAGQAVVIGGCGSGWIPSASLGAGAAALPQWINFNEFGRCLDVTGQNVNAAYLIDYPCKQNPYPSAKTWNQLFTAPANTTKLDSVSGQIYTTVNNTRYCLSSPGTVNGYITVRTCVTGDTLQNWTLYSGNATLPYSSRYTIVNGSLCMGLGTPNAGLTAWSTIIVETCTGATDQKWNAVAGLLSSSVKDTYEK